MLKFATAARNREILISVIGATNGSIARQLPVNLEFIFIFKNFVNDLILFCVCQPLCRRPRLRRFLDSLPKLVVPIAEVIDSFQKKKTIF